MLEYFTYKKVKKHRAEKAAKQDAQKAVEASRLSETGPIDVADAPRSGKHRRSHSQRPSNHDDDDDANPDPDPDPDSDPDLDRAVIRPGDESFLEELIASDDAPAPPLPPRLYSRDLDWPSDSEDAAS
ncbi:hypothetical protein E4U42_003040, partial [Claviceps africana]